jgi:hypothetical protein
LIMLGSGICMMANEINDATNCVLVKDGELWSAVLPSSAVHRFRP